MTEDNARMLGHRNGVVTAVMIVRREIGTQSEQLRRTPQHHVRKREVLEMKLAMLKRLDAAMDHELRQSLEAYVARKRIE